MAFFRALVLITGLSLAVFGEVIPFSLPSKDRLTKITGQIDKPECGMNKYAAVMMVSGTGLFTRDSYFGRSGSQRDFVFTDLAARLKRNCIASVRFDSRGVNCNLVSKADLAKCIDQRVRATVTDQTILDDIQLVYEFMLTRQFIDSRRTVLLGHSEGSLNISRLVAAKTVNPKAILFMGGLTESAKSILHWQIAERPVEQMFHMDLDKNQILTNQEITMGHKNSAMSATPLEKLLSPTGSWTKQNLRNEFEKVYHAVSADALSKKDSEPYHESGVIFTSYRWWKRWFRDDVSVLQNLKDYSGLIEYHNGDIDTQTPGLRESYILKKNKTPMKSVPSFVLYPSKGHGLSSNPLYGPIDESIANVMVSRITQWLK